MKSQISIAISIILIAISCNQKAKQEPIIDMHQHARFEVFVDENGQPSPRVCFPQPCEPIESLVKRGEDVLPFTLAQMDKYNIVKAVVSDENLDDVYKWKESAPEKFLAGCGFFSIQAADSNRISEEFKSGNLQIMGEIGVQYDGMDPDDEKLNKYFSIAEEYDVPVLIHCEGLGGGDNRFRLSSGNPLLLEEVLIKYPGLRIYVENAGWPFLDEMTSIMYRYSNVSSRTKLV